VVAKELFPRLVPLHDVAASTHEGYRNLFSLRSDEIPAIDGPGFKPFLADFPCDVAVVGDRRLEGSTEREEHLAVRLVHHERAQRPVKLGVHVRYTQERRGSNGRTIGLRIGAGLAIADYGLRFALFIGLKGLGTSTPCRWKTSIFVFIEL